MIKDSSIAILTPTRNRANNCERFIKSIYNTSPWQNIVTKNTMNFINVNLHLAHLCPYHNHGISLRIRPHLT